jgi:hypothetical protein
MASYLAAGMRVVFSADTGLLGQFHGFAEHRELEALVAAGVPPLPAIQAATQASARLLGLDSAQEPSRRASAQTSWCWTATLSPTSPAPAASPPSTSPAGRSTATA